MVPARCVAEVDDHAAGLWGCQACCTAGEWVGQVHQPGIPTPVVGRESKAKDESYEPVDVKYRLQSEEG